MLIADSDEIARAHANAKANVISHALSDWDYILSVELSSRLLTVVPETLPRNRGRRLPRSRSPSGFDTLLSNSACYSGAIALRSRTVFVSGSRVGPNLASRVNVELARDAMEVTVFHICQTNSNQLGYKHN
jgi:hypothetical protein